MLTAKDIKEVVRRSEEYLSECNGLLDKYDKTQNQKERNEYLDKIHENQQTMITYFQSNLVDMLSGEVEPAARMYVERYEHVMDLYEKFGERLAFIIKDIISGFDKK